MDASFALFLHMSCAAVDAFPSYVDFHCEQAIDGIFPVEMSAL
jgi:hypothetical protein